MDTVNPDSVVDADADARILQALKVRGFADGPGLADATGFDVAIVEARLETAEAEGLVKRLKGRMTGFRLSPAGDERRRALVQNRAAGEAPELRAAYDAFLTPNEALKERTTAWQLSDRGAAAVADVLSGLEGVQEQAAEVVRLAAVADDRFERYGVRLTAALDRVRAGDTDAVAKPMSGSFHDVWMELHEDLLSTLGRTRSADDGH